MKPRKFDRPGGERPRTDRPFQKFRKDGPPRAEGEFERPFRKPFGHDPRAQFDDEQFTATGELADIVGTHPLDRREILRRMWRHYQDAGLVKSTGGGTRRPPRERSERPPRSFEDRPPRSSEDRPPRRFEGEREGAPRRYERKPEGAPSRYGRKRDDDGPRFTRDRDEGSKPFSRKPSRAPRVSTRKPSDKHPAGKRAEAISKVPRRKFKETRDQD